MPKILCIEDDLDMIDYIKLILGKAGYEVIGADGGVKGLEAMRQEQPDLVLRYSGHRPHGTELAV
jgi:CheY-like chemotaxis protein